MCFLCTTALPATRDSGRAGVDRIAGIAGAGLHDGRVAPPRKTLALALEKGADVLVLVLVLVQVKGNQPTLLAACEDLARYCAPAQCDMQHDKGHGRIETRTVRTWGVPANWLAAAGTADRERLTYGRTQEPDWRLGAHQ